MEQVKVTQTRSSIGISPTHKKTLIALGLKKKGQTKAHSLTPQIAGMIDQVKYLLTVEKA